MIKTENGTTEVKALTPEELFGDMIQIITTFITFSKSLGIPEEEIEKILMHMVVDGFNGSDGKNLIDLSGEEIGED